MWIFKAGIKGYFNTAKEYRRQYYKMRGFITTSSKELDRLLDYGIEPDTKYLFYGKAGSGKTFLLHQIAANMFKNKDYSGCKLIYLDLEGNFSIKLLDKLSGSKILRNVYVKKIYDKEGFMEELKKILLSNINLGMLLIDNISEIASSDIDPGIAHVWMRQVLYILSLIKEKFYSPIVITTRVYAKPHIFSANLTRPRGGLALLTMVNKIINLSRLEGNIFRAVDEYSMIPAALFKITENGIYDA